MSKILMSKILFVLAIGFLIASENHFKMKNGIESNMIKFNIGDISIEKVGEDSKIVSNVLGTLSGNGMPELPVYSTLYQVASGVEIDVELVINASHRVSDITLLPSRIFAEDGVVVEKNSEIYNSSQVYPKENLIVS